MASPEQRPESEAGALPVDGPTPHDSSMSCVETKDISLPAAPRSVPANPFAGLSLRCTLLTNSGSTVDAAAIEDLVPQGHSLHSLLDTGSSGGTWWLDIAEPTAEEVNTLASAFTIHPLTSEDIRTGESHEKLEVFKNYYFVIFRSFNKTWKAGKTHLEPCNVYIIVFPEGVISFSQRPSLHATNVRNRLRTLRDHLRLSSDWICYALM
jgi:magnesium transporter